MDNSIFALLLLALLGSVAGLFGGIIFLINKNWAKILGIYAVPFAAGVLLSVSVLHLVPEASEMIGYNAFLYVLMAFLGSFIFEKYFASMHHHEEHSHGGTLHKSTIPLVILGDTIHNFIDGVAIAAAFLVNPYSGFVVAMSTFLHETPHEIGDFGVLISRGWTPRKTFFANFLSSLATIPGALMVYYFFPNGANDQIGVFLAISAGIFLYLGASDFLPEIDEHDTKRMTFIKVLLVVVGASLMYFISQIFPEIH